MEDNTEKFPTTPNDPVDSEESFWDDDEFAAEEGEPMSLSEKYEEKEEGTFFSRHKWVIIPLIIAVLLASAFGIGSAVLTAFSPKETVSSTDFRTVAKKDVIDRVSVKGTIQPIRTATLSTKLTTPVQDLPVAVGDRVKANQLLARMDTSSLERELDSQRQQQSASSSESQNAIKQAQQQLAQQREKLDRGLNQEINSANSALRDANLQLEGAKQDFANRAQQVEKDNDPALQQQKDAAEQARKAARDADLARAQAEFGLATVQRVNGAAEHQADLNRARLDQLKNQDLSRLTPELREAAEQEIASLQNTIDGENGARAERDQSIANAVTSLRQAENQASDAKDARTKAENRYADALATSDQELGQLQRKVNAAENAVSDATVGVEAAKLGAKQGLETSASALDQAVNSAAAANASSDLANNKLMIDIDSADVNSPFDGIVTALPAQKGAPATGPIVTVADDSRKKIVVQVKEVDLPKVTKDSKVRFTTPSTGDKEFTGKVVKVSPVANDPMASMSSGASGEGSAAAAGAGSTDVTFPVEIEITGGDELRLGSSAKAQIIRSETHDTIAVPRDAVFTNDAGKTAVLVLTGSGNKGTIEEREVTTGNSNDFDTSISSGLEESDRVITTAEKYRDKVGATAKVEMSAKGA
ncbi:HlyD family efflux transporter periplasmic adaptor subunit [Corynebacterium sp. HMSC073D01]|uniref:HlyD family efflux transporter periplasmic adaptor subunit n=1 Tax=Corynebacterium sp. HMSC073D01 TaxID=1739536 RepID=UPI0008A4B523|nr:HlyD family efflux transporter periplasmic adaptor subunit [Corynebacterium sp. HMSC073D01]OFO42433.1 transporter [Corynebacterium sp. HMSC073D01]